MKFSVFQLPLSPSPDQDSRVIGESLRQAELAEALGFDGVWLAEHNFTGESAFADPIVFATAIAGRTSRVEIGFAVLQLALHHPVRLAIQLALLDQLSNGRLRVGIGRGSAFNQWEYAGFGLTIEDGRQRFAEALDLLIKSWTARDLQYEGEFYRVEVPAIRPAPVQQPHPPIYRSVLTPESTAEVGRQGYPILFPRLLGPTIRERLGTYAEAMRAAGHPEDQVQANLAGAGFLKSVYVAPTDEEAWADVQEPIARQLAALNESRARYNKPTNDDTQRVPATTSDGQRMTTADEGAEPLDPQPVVDTRISETMQRGLVVGSPETVLAQVRELHGYGLNHLMAAMSWGDMPFDRVERSMRLFAEHVIPALRDS